MADFWTSKTDLPTPARRELAALTIGSDKGYVYAGLGLSMNQCDEYLQAGNSWVSKTDLPTPDRYQLAASAIGSDKGYVYGGLKSDGATYLQDCDEYSQSGNSWVNKTDLPTPARSKLAASTIGSDKGYVYGGNCAAYYQDCDEYSQSGNNWTNKTDMPTPGRDKLAASTIGSDKGYVYGGSATYPYYLKDCDEYSQAGNSWVSKTDLPTPARNQLAASTIGSDKGYIYGGYNDGYYYQDCDEYSQSDNSWVSKTDMPTPARSQFAASTIGSYKGYVYGGFNGGAALVDCDEYTAFDLPSETALYDLKSDERAGLQILKDFKGFADADWPTIREYLKGNVETRAEIFKFLKSFADADHARVFEYLKTDLKAHGWFSSLLKSFADADWLYGEEYLKTELAAMGWNYQFLKAHTYAHLREIQDLASEISVQYEPDFTPPFLGYRPSPYSGQTNVKVNQKTILRIRDLGRGVDIDTVWVEIEGVKYQKGDPEFSYAGDKTEYMIVVRPTASWDYNRQITVKVYAEDLAGNPGLEIEKL